MRAALQPSALSALLLTVCIAAAAPAWADTYSLTPTDDVCTRSDLPNTAGAPTSTLLYVGGPIVSTNDYWTTYVKFDLSSFSVAGNLSSATLSMTCNSHSGSSVNVSAYEVTSEIGSWNEYYMSQQTADTTFTVATTPSAVTTINSSGGTFTWNVTTPAQNHVGGDLTIVLKEQYQPSSGSWAIFYSKDQSQAAKPNLSVTYTPPEPPDPRAYIDFDPSIGIENVAMPDVYNPVDAYVSIDQMTDGLTTASFAMSVTPGMSAVTSFEPLLPGLLAIGDWETGITVASTECVGVGGEPVNIGVLHLLYTGVPGDVMLIDHPDYPRWVVDCQSPGQVNYYCVLSHGGVGKPAIQGDCGAVPVQPKSWGAIKAMYQ